MRVLCLVGTRPEAVKLAPVVLRLRREPERFEARVCATGQHGALVAEALACFGLRADVTLPELAEAGLGGLTGRLVAGLQAVIEAERPDWVVVQGDTASAFAGALAAMYAGVRVAHVEAGLRTGDLAAPFPEEAHRALVARVAALHLAPTERARANLSAEGVTAGVHVVGNTGIDALLWARERVRARGGGAWPGGVGVPEGRRVVLATAHRRELSQAGLEAIALALRDTARRFPDVQVVLPVHLRPGLRAPLAATLAGEPNVTLTGPLGYLDAVALLARAHVVVTDSGGLQEEAPALGKPVLVTREKTERVEGVEAGVAMLVGADRARVAGALATLLGDEAAYARMARVAMPYGDGRASARIRDLLAGA